MKGQLAVQAPEQYIAQLEEPRRTEVARLDRLIRKTVPQLEPSIVSGTLAYGPVHYRYASGREGNAARLSVASNASAISLYALAVDDEGWVAERYRTRLPKAKIGKSCIRFKRLDDLDLEAFKALLRHAAESAFPAHGGTVTKLSSKISSTRAAARHEPPARKSTRKNTRKSTPKSTPKSAPKSQSGRARRK